MLLTYVDKILSYLESLEKEEFQGYMTVVYFVISGIIAFSLAVFIGYTGE